MPPLNRTPETDFSFRWCLAKWKW